MFDINNSTFRHLFLHHKKCLFFRGYLYNLEIFSIKAEQLIYNLVIGWQVSKPVGKALRQSLCQYQIKLEFFMKSNWRSYQNKMEVVMISKIKCRWSHEIKSQVRSNQIVNQRRLSRNLDLFFKRNWRSLSNQIESGYQI